MEVKSVSAELVKYLRKKIIIGELSPGQKLDENPLSSDLGVSRPPLQEAFRILERENIV
jgi:DNA-binding GntR family transcriptional regulator